MTDQLLTLIRIKEELKGIAEEDLSKAERNILKHIKQLEDWQGMPLGSQPR
jgi:hypothetical protein